MLYEVKTLLFLKYCKRRKIHWAKHSRFSRFSRVLQKFFREYKCFSLIILNNKHFQPRQRESISKKTSMGLKTQTFSPVNLSPSTVRHGYDLILRTFQLFPTEWNLLCHSGYYFIGVNWKYFGKFLNKMSEY